MPEPINKKLYSKVKKLADKKFSSKTGIYKSSWIVREYKKRGGKYSGKKNTKSGLKRWFAEDWVDLNRKKNGKYEKCGRKSAKTGKYPVCRPSKRITSKTPRTFREISRKSLTKAKRLKSLLKSSGNVQFGSGNKDSQKEESSQNNYIFVPFIIGAFIIGLINI